MSIIIEQAQYTLVPTGDYKARIAEIVEDEGVYGPQVKFAFLVVGGEFDDQTLLGWCSAKFSSQSKLYQWTRAAFGADIPTEYAFNSDDLLGRNVILTVIVREKDDGTEFNKIERVRTRGSNSTGPAPQPAGYPPQPESPPASDDDEIPF